MSYLRSYRRRQRARGVFGLLGILALGTLAAWINANMLLPRMGLEVPEIHFWGLALVITTVAGVMIKGIQEWIDK